MSSAKAFFLLMLVYLTLTLCNSSAEKVSDQLYTRKLLNLRDMLNYANSIFTAKLNVIQRLQGIAGKPHNNTVKYRKKIETPVTKKRRSKDVLKDGYISMEEIVRNRLKEMRSLLQDDDVISFSEDNRDTTIVKLVPKDKQDKRPLKEAINDSAKELNEKFNKVRTTVNTVLDSEAMSKKNKYFLINVFDDLTRQIVKSHCSATTPLRSGSKIDIETANELKKSWIKKWHNIKKNATADLPSDDLRNTVKPILEQFETFFAEIIKELNDFSVKYRLQCSDVAQRQGSVVPNLSLAIKYTDTYECPSFVVCSENLQNFLLEFNKSLLRTTNAALERYEAMYSRDVNPKAADEGKQVVEAVKMVRIAIKSEIAKIFEEAVNSFQLSKSKSENENTKIINKFILETVKQVKEAMSETLKKKSSTLRENLQDRIENDVYMSVGSELDSLGNLLIEDICTMFKSCNGKISTRRTMEEEKGPFVVFAPSNRTDVSSSSCEEDTGLKTRYTINLHDYTHLTVTRTTTNSKIT